MDLLQGNVKRLYFKYLTAAFGSSLIGTIYSFVDTIVVGQNQGSNGTAALAVVAPVWNIIYGLGLLFGIGGAVFFSTIRGKKEKQGEHENEYFTVAVIAGSIAALICWIALVLLDTQILSLFGADRELLPLAEEYLRPIKVVFPTYLFGQLLAAFLRNDGNPALATAAVLAGGIFNIFGDCFFVFALHMGIFGAGLATAIGSVLSAAIMATHFVSKKNSMKIVKVQNGFSKLKSIIAAGFSTFFVDIAMGIITVLLNNQIMKYAGTGALAVYGVIVNISTCAQGCVYSIGQAAQPIISINFGAENWGRIKKILKYSLVTAAVFSAFWTGVTMLFPVPIIKIFMSATPEVISLAPKIIRLYCLSFLLLPLNVYSTYYFQAISRPKIAFVISIYRGLVISGVMILFLPVIAEDIGLWLAMPFTELLVAIIAIYYMGKYTRELGEKTT